MILIFLIFIILPIFISINVLFDKNNQKISFAFKVFLFTLFRGEIRIKEKIIEVFSPKEKLIKFSNLKLSKPKNTWILKGLKGTKSLVELNVNFNELAKNIKETFSLVGVISSLAIVQKNMFKKSKNKTLITNSSTMIKIGATFYTNIILLAIEWVEFLIKNKKEVKNANTKLYTKSN